MPIFGQYSRFYDTLYHDKDYEAECDFLEKIFERNAGGGVRTILDLGCGTGNHVIPLANRGYRVTGIDISESMLAEAGTKAKANCSPSNLPTFHKADIRDFNLNQTYDAVISMFAVISYLATNEDIQKAFRQVRWHLQTGGLFIFDAWHGPAVLFERPTDRYKIIEMPGERIIRFAHPEIDILRHTVDVHYRLIRLSGDRVLDEVCETHTMRFLFPQEIIFHLDCAGFQLINLWPFMRIGEIPDEHDWNLMVVAKAL